MPAVKTVRSHFPGHGDYSYKISVDKEGLFSTTLPKDIVTILKAAKVTIRSNRLGTEGYIHGDTLASVSGQVHVAVAEAASLVEVDHSFILRYAIDTRCSYCKTVAGEFAPNGNWDDHPEGYDWKGGTTAVHATFPSPFGFMFYACVFRKITKESKSGRTVIEYEKVKNSKSLGENGHFLCEIPSIHPPDRSRIYEVEYSDEVAEFFVNLFKVTCSLTERFNGLVEPDKLLSAIAKGNAGLLI